MRSFLIPAVCVVALLGCDNTIQPLVPGAEGGLALYGALDTAADTQFVRLDPVRVSSTREPVSLREATVWSIGGPQGRIDWTYRPITLEDGSMGDAFFALFKPVPGERYTVHAQSPAGDPVEGSVTVPTAPMVIPLPPRGDDRTLMQDIRLEGLNRVPLNLTVVYEVKPPESTDPVLVPVNYGQGNGRTDLGWEFIVFLARDQATILTAVDRSISDRDVEFRSVRVRVGVLSPEWSDPNESDNLSNERGFLGAIGRFELEWQLQSGAVSTLGFVDAQ